MVCNFNRRGHLKECLKSISCANLHGTSYDIDNGVYHLDEHGNYVMDIESYNHVINFKNFKKVFSSVFSGLFVEKFRAMKALHSTS